MTGFGEEPECRPPECRGELRGTTARIRLAGAIDHTMDAELVAMLDGFCGPFARVIVDAREVTFCATGLNFLARLAARGGAVQMLGSPPRAHRAGLLHAAGLHTQVTLLSVEART